MKGVAPIKSEYLVASAKVEEIAVTTSNNVESTAVSQPASEPTLKSAEKDESVPASEPTSEKRAPDTDGGNAKKRRRKGQNKQREKFSNQRPAQADRLCKAVLCGTTCSYGDVCKFSHDIAKFISQKPADLPGECVNYKAHGYCQYSFACRFAQSHVQLVDGIYTNMTNKDVVSNSKSVNSLNKDNMMLLKKRKYDFSNSAAATKEAQEFVDKIVRRNVEINSTKKLESSADGKTEEVAKPIKDSGDTVTVSESDSTKPVGNSSTSDSESAKPVSDCATSNSENNKLANNGFTSNSESAKPVIHSSVSNSDGVDCSKETSLPTSQDAVCSPVGPLTDEQEFAIKPGEKKTINFDNKLYLAPLTTVGNLPFRRVCKTFGADITCGEMAVATKLLQGVSSEWALVKRHSSEDVFGVQLCGAFADSMSKCTQLLTETCELDFIDINVGCPIDLIFDQGSGSALMRRVNRFHEIVRAMVNVSNIPITAKIRTGISETKSTAHNLVTKMKTWDLALTTLHGRSREQRYTKCADWSYIDECAKLSSPMPLYGGGDILSFEDYNTAMKTSVSGTMIARGALIKPWLFTEIKEQRHWDISSSERLDILRDFSNYGLEHWGSDTQGVETTRRFMLEWISFLHRYIPIGLLERVPQKINERPSPYFGRNDLETLMASPNSADWVKISEMLLGPVPDGFFFIPKHRANSYS